jgi:hypothetical protein
MLYQTELLKRQSNIFRCKWIGLNFALLASFISAHIFFAESGHGLDSDDVNSNADYVGPRLGGLRAEMVKYRWIICIEKENYILNKCL